MLHLSLTYYSNLTEVLFLAKFVPLSGSYNGLNDNPVSLFSALTGPSECIVTEQCPAEGEARGRDGHRYDRRLPGLLASLRHHLLCQDGRIERHADGVSVAAPLRQELHLLESNHLRCSE